MPVASYGRRDGGQGKHPYVALNWSAAQTFCSPEDQAVLEAEYDNNPKPDKVARLEIVKRVALGEKEVQVCAICWLFHVVSRKAKEYACVCAYPCLSFLDDRYGSKTGVK